MNKLIAIVALTSFVLGASLSADEGKCGGGEKAPAKGCCPAGKNKEGCPKDGAGEKGCPAKEKAPEKAPEKA
jgi:hypothetical protein